MFLGLHVLSCDMWLTVHACQSDIQNLVSGYRNYIDSNSHKSQYIGIGTQAVHHADET